MTVMIGQAVRKLLRKFAIEKPVQQHEILFQWKAIVGETIAQHTQPEDIKFDKLYIRVDSPVWRNELIFQKGQLLEKINQRLSKNAQIKEIVLR